MRKIENSIKGYTKADYQSIIKTSINEVDKITLFISNTGASESLKYKVIVYVENLTKEYDSETVLSAEETHETVISNTAYSKVEVQIKNGSGKTSYKIAYIKNM